MLVFNTELHIITFLIILIEMVFFCHQVIYYLSRPTDKNRLYFLILLFLLIQHNLVGGLLPDKNIPIPIIVQNIIAYAVAFAMSMYFPYYFYKAFKLEKMKFYAYWGNILFLFGPFLLCFVIPYYLTNNFALSRKLAMIVPFFYTLSFFYSLRYAINARNKALNNVGSKKDALGMYIAVILFGFLSLIAFFETDLNNLLKPILHFHNGSQVVEILTTNSGLLVMTFLFIRQTVKQSKDEYNKLLISEKQLQVLNSELLESQKELQGLNSELVAKVKERTKELERANEHKTQAFINLAHETKTPLTLITNYLDEYIRKYGQPENEELKLLKKSIGNLTKDIVNFFDMEKIQKGINIYDHTHISDFSLILRESMALFKVFASKKKIELVDTISDNIFIKADPSALYRIINNLIENAIKYTPDEGKIEIDVVVINNKINFCVKDTGIGIPLSLQTQIFEPYFQINSKKSNFQGMGLGLSIVKKILIEIKGEIAIKSNPQTGEGTTVFIELLKHEKSEGELVMEFPIDTDQPFEAEKLNIKEQNFDESKYTILIVEDNIELLNYIVGTLQKQFNVHFAINGQEAIEKLKSINQLDLIVSDVMMDNGDGYYLAQHVQKSKRLGHIPFIFLTAKNTSDARIEGLSLGAIDFICKPVSMDELEIKINSLLKNMLNQRNAILNSAINSIMTKKEIPVIQELPSAERSASTFESNCTKYNLSVREIEIICLLTDGKIAKEIADILFISVDTVRKHIQNAHEKVGVSSKFELLKKLQANVFQDLVPSDLR